MTAKDYTGAIDGFIKTACDTAFTLSVEQIIAFIKQTIECICAEMSSNGKKPVISAKEAYARAMKIYFDAEDGELREDINFFSDKDAFASIYNNLNTLLTIRDYHQESRAIVEQLKCDEKFAYSFLYGNSPVPGKSIARLRSRFKNMIRTSYHIEISDETIATIIYEHLWSDGTWKILNSYDYRSTFFQWLSIIASHQIIKYLDDNGFIKVNRKRTPGNTRIVWKDKDPVVCQMMLDVIIHIPTVHKLLTALYVDRKSQEDIQKEFDFNDENYRLALRASEKTLKVALLNTEHRYEDFLVDKSARKLIVSSDFLTIIGQTTADSYDDSPLREVIGATPEDPDFETKFIDFLYNFSNGLGWSSEDLFVWQSRYIKNMKPDEVAQKLSNRSRPWVDTRFSRLNRQFKNAIREWWNNINR